jgi:hypothetical protein
MGASQCSPSYNCNNPLPPGLQLCPSPSDFASLWALALSTLVAYSVDCLLCRDPRPTDGTLVPIPPPGPIAWGEIQRERHLGGFASVASCGCGCLGANSGHGMGIGPIRVLKDERVVDAVS